MRDKSNSSEPIGTLYYFGDPMCSWCWGIKPVLEQIDQEYPELRRVTVMGGLRPGELVPMGDQLAELIQNAWVRIEQTTGQPFNHELWKNHRPLATTLPACRAVLAVRLLAPEREWDFMVGMFQAYFLKAMDPTMRETHLHVAWELGLDVETFGNLLESDAVTQTLKSDLRRTKAFGITGFPSLVLSLNNSHYLISPGYQPMEEMRRAINAAYEDAGVTDLQRPESGIYS